MGRRIVSKRLPGRNIPVRSAGRRVSMCQGERGNEFACFGRLHARSAAGGRVDERPEFMVLASMISPECDRAEWSQPFKQRVE
jgi:hypothetical protein